MPNEPSEEAVRTPIDPTLRFWRKVQKSDGCWIWIGSKYLNGYGKFYAGFSRPRVPAHRWSYEQLRGKIPDGLMIDHLCRNPLCVNPAHLEPVTNKENVLRGTGLTAQNRSALTVKPGPGLSFCCGE